jgi:aspartyl-tRNA(Asn)/glutamyl-tRNA(Gln) amidotransferase subunit A
MDEHVAQGFERGVGELARAGTTISRRPVAELLRIPEINSRGGIATAEAYAWHRPLLDRRDQYDPRVASRILKAHDFTDAYVRELHDARADVINTFEQTMNEGDALVLPTTPIIPPPLSAFDLDADYARLNALVLRNPTLGNFLDGCGISLPVHRKGDAPVGLMLIGRRGTDERLLAIARAMETVLNRARE